jgi:hypothetical protein
VVSIAHIERPLLFHLSLEDGLDWSPTARVQRGTSETARCTSTGDHLACPLILPPSSLVSSQGWGLIDLLLRATFSPALPRARRDALFSLARAFKSSSSLVKGVTRLSFTARIERAQFHRARSASKKGTWPLPPHTSEAARCASTEDHQAPSPPPSCSSSG